MPAIVLPDQPTAYEKLSSTEGEIEEVLDKDAQQQKENAEREKQEYEEFFEWQKAKPFVKALIDDFQPVVNMCSANRQRRRVDIDIKAEQDAGRLKKSDIIIPMRVIDQSIAQEKPSLVAYLQQSRRLAIFSDVMYPMDKHDALEAAFTRGMQYEKWLDTHTQIIDGAQLNGWDWAEVLFDETKPLFTCVEHVGHDRLIFPIDSEDIQNCSRIARWYKWTKLQLRSFVKKKGFDSAQVEKLISSNQQKDVENNSQKDRVYNIYKVYFKYNNCVYVAWASTDVCDEWIKKPEKFYNGVDQLVSVVKENPPAPQLLADGSTVMLPQAPTISQEWQEVEETEYPVCLYAYEKIEEKKIRDSQGRAFKDKFKQEAMTAGWSSFLNGHNRATWLMGGKAENDGKPASELQNVELKDGVILPFNVAWNKMPYPDPSMLQALQVFDAKIHSDNGQMTYAVQSKSSGARTSAREVESAERSEQLNASVNVSMLASYVRNVCVRSWRIVQSQALQDNIVLLGQVIQGPPNPLTGEAEADPTFVNSKEIVGRKFDVRPAGDVDYIQRVELINDMMQFWEVVQNTPIAGDFLAHLLKIKFGELGDLWAAKLLQGDIKTQLLMQCLQILSGLAANPQEAMAMTPQDQQNLQQLIVMIGQALTPTTQPSQANANATQQPATSGGNNTGGSPMDESSSNTEVLPTTP